ncbi:MAG: AMP-binding protein [Candidatus Lambdaproteobacteria bacterium]|nr:AMP-binding protein [Candidatus Lambdaproteobacteria bacterium]
MSASTDLHASTLSALLRQRAALHGGATAARQKRYGIWQPLTWRELEDKARQVARGLRALGLGHGEHVAILAANSIEWMAAQHAIGLAGGIPVGIYPSLTGAEIADVLARTHARAVIFDTLARLDKVLPHVAALPDLQHYVAVEERALHGQSDARITSLDRLMELQAGADAQGPEPGPDDLALIATTAGTTGDPRLIFLSHGNLIAAARALGDRLAVRATDRTVSVLPLGHPAEQALSVVLPLLTGMSVNFSESPRTMQGDIREIAPTILAGPPRMWQKLRADLLLRIQQTGRLRQNLLNRALGSAPSARREAPGETGGDARPAAWQSLLLFRPLKRHFGLNSLRCALSTGGMLPPAVADFFRSVGTNIRDAYSVGAAAGIVAVAAEHDRSGELLPLDRLLVRASPQGLLHFQGAQVSAQALQEDGWALSGDVGETTRRGLLLRGRAPGPHDAAECGAAVQRMEAGLKTDALIREAVLLSNGRQGLVAAVQADAGLLGAWATQHQLPFAGFRSLVSLPAATALIGQRLQRGARSLPAAHGISGYVVLDQELSNESGELTPLMNARRQRVAERVARLDLPVHPLAEPDGGTPAAT